MITKLTRCITGTQTPVFAAAIQRQSMKAESEIDGLLKYFVVDNLLSPVVDTPILTHPVLFVIDETMHVSMNVLSSTVDSSLLELTPLLSNVSNSTSVALVVSCG